MTNMPIIAGRYALSMRVIHWVMALCIIGALLLGFFGEELPSAWRGSALRLHKTLGITVIILLPLRILLRNLTPIPPMPAAHPMERKLAHYTHQLLYLAMAWAAGTGYVMIAAKGKAIAWFGIEIPSLMAINLPLAKLARSWHEPAAYLLLALLALHLAGLIKHALIDKTNPLKPML